MFYVRMIEQDAVVGNSAPNVTRNYIISTHDTLIGANRALSATEHALDERIGNTRDVKRMAIGHSRPEWTQTIVDHGLPHEQGNVYRITYITVTLDK